MKDQARYLKEWDIFISYASEDKDAIARPIAELLRRHGLRVWFDEFELSVGRSLTKSINYGLANSSYGIVILSPRFLAKKWPQKELAALVALEETETGRILPVWHELGAEELKQCLPMLADIVAVQSSGGVPFVVRELLRAVNLPFIGKGITGAWAGPTGRLRLFDVGETLQGDYDWAGHQWAGHLEGSLESHERSHFRGYVFRFNWWWDLSREKGNGFFVALRRPVLPSIPYESYTRLYDYLLDEKRDSSVLIGSWAFDYEGLNTQGDPRRLLTQRPHPWDFRRNRDEATLNSDLLSYVTDIQDERDVHGKD